MIAATVKRYWDFVAGHVFGTGRLPEPQTRPNWIVTQADLDEAAGVDPDARYAVPFQVAGRAILSETPVLTPRQILRAAGRDPDSPDDTAGVVLVRLDNDHAREVYAPLAFDAELTVAAGDRFAVWAGDDTRLHWYTVNGLRQVSLFYALPPHGRPAERRVRLGPLRPVREPRTATAVVPEQRPPARPRQRGRLRGRAAPDARSVTAGTGLRGRENHGSRAELRIRSWRQNGSRR